jgi:hypothetical protein
MCHGKKERKRKRRRRRIIIIIIIRNEQKQQVSKRCLGDLITAYPSNIISYR